jgi:hypothetical protein
MADSAFTDTRPAAVTNPLSRWFNKILDSRPIQLFNNWAIAARAVQTSQMPVNGIDGSR